VRDSVLVRLRLTSLSTFGNDQPVHGYNKAA
jgi:hypothetical protein